MIDDKAHNPCNSKLEEDKADGDPSAFRFPADRCNSCGTRNIQKTEYHEGVALTAPNPIVPKVAAIADIP